MQHNIHWHTRPIQRTSNAYTLAHNSIQADIRDNMHQTICHPGDNDSLELHTWSCHFSLLSVRLGGAGWVFIESIDESWEGAINCQIGHGLVLAGSGLGRAFWVLLYNHIWQLMATWHISKLILTHQKMYPTYLHCCSSSLPSSKRHMHDLMVLCTVSPSSVHMSCISWFPIICD